MFTILSATIVLQADESDTPVLSISVDDYAAVNPDVNFLIALFRKAANELEATDPYIERTADVD